MLRIEESTRAISMAIRRIAGYSRLGSHIRSWRRPDVEFLNAGTTQMERVLDPILRDDGCTLVSMNVRTFFRTAAPRRQSLTSW